MAKRKNTSKQRRGSKEAPPPKLPEAVLEILYQQHKRLHQVTGIVSCARYACEAKDFGNHVGEPDVSGGLEVAHNILCDAAEALEEVIPLTYFHEKNDEEGGE